MNIELGVLSDGNVMLVSDRPLPDIVRRVEYYKEQKLFMLVYNNKEHESELMHYEVPADLTLPVERTPNILIYSLFPDHEPIGYKVPLVQVGGLY
jgi:hypothetical protein